MGRKRKIDAIQEEVKLEGSQMGIEVVISDENTLENIRQEIDAARQELEKTKIEIEEKRASLKANAAREISDQEINLIEKQITRGNSKETLRAKIDKQRDKDSEMVTGRFMNRRAPGQGAKLPYIKYDTDPVKWYPLEDGKVYTIPRGFADQLNGGTEEDPCYYTPKFAQKPGEMDPNMPASAIHSVDTSNKKYAFTPINF